MPNLVQRLSLQLKQSPQQVLLSSLLQLPVLSLEQKIKFELEMNPLLELEDEMEIETTLEEEVLMHKDIYRHSSTRRTITRFIAAILIAVSIESLLLMFKSVLGSPEHLANAVAMMAAAIGLLVGLGIYVYLGAKAEATLKQSSFTKTNNTV